MTRAAYTDLIIKTPRTATTYPTQAHCTAVITGLYKEASAVYILNVSYSATVPDTDVLFAIIVSKVSAWVEDVQSYRRKETTHMAQPPYYFNDKEIARLTQTKTTVERTIWYT